MDGETKTHRLWRAFCTYSHPAHNAMTYPQVTKQNQPLYKDILKMLSPIQTLHAAEESEDKPKTSIEKLGQGRPAILISDEEIREYLSKESGKDRLKALFTKGYVMHLVSLLEYIIYFEFE